MIFLSKGTGRVSRSFTSWFRVKLRRHLPNVVFLLRLGNGMS
jgi:hypothetical protein